MILGENSDDIMSPKDTYLAHYGVKGMKWGVRKQRRQERKGVYRPRTYDLAMHLGKKAYETNKDFEPKVASRKATGYLNSLDQRRAQAQYDSDRFAKKAGKARSKGRSKREAKNLQKVANNERLIEQAKSETNRVLSELKRRELSVYTKDINRPATNRGRENVVACLTGGLGSLALFKVYHKNMPSTGYIVKPRSK